MEHLQHFGLARDPFCNEPLLDLFMETAPHRDALRRLDRGVRQHKGLCVLTGAVGAGKTMVVRRLFEDLEEEVFEAGLLVVPNGTADACWLLKRFARQLGVEEPPEEREPLLAEIYDRLAIVREDGRHAVLIVDDAQALASSEALAEVCGLLKLEYEERRLLTLVLAGDPPLGEMLGGDPVLAHRTDVKVALQPLDPETGMAYLTHRIQGAGGTVAILEEEAVAQLHRLGAGLPGRINTLADNALFEAFLHGRPRMTGPDVELAWKSLSWESGAAAPAPAAAAAPALAPAPTLDLQPDGAATVAMLGDEPDLMPAPPAAQEAPLESLDSELEAAFATGPGLMASPDASQELEILSSPASPKPATAGNGANDGGEDLENLLVELIDD